MATPPNNYFAQNVITIPDALPNNGGTGSGIEIPKIKVGTIRGEVMGSLDFYQTDTWKSLNPKIFLFTPKKRRIQKSEIGRPDYVSPRPSRMVHPTHLAGSNVKWWGGIPRYSQNNGNGIILRHTEFVLPVTTPYKQFSLNNMGLDPYEWCVYTNLENGVKRQTVQSDFPVSSNNLGKWNGIDNPFYVSLGKAYGYSDPLPIGFSNQKKKFKFAIVIDNPNPTADSPYLIGPMSDTVVLKFKHLGSNGQNIIFGLTFTPDHISNVIASS